MPKHLFSAKSLILGLPISTNSKSANFAKPASTLISPEVLESPWFVEPKKRSPTEKNGDVTQQKKGVFKPDPKSGETD
jgi:hypothetical protein